jgi:hypothetical protein
VRAALLLGVVLVAVAAKPAAFQERKCTHVSRGFRACTTVLELENEQSAIYRRAAHGWTTVVGGVRREPGWWRRVVAAPGRRTLLAQWSGECEIQSTYLVSPAGGRIRPIFRDHESTIEGWTSSGLARVRLAEAIWGRDRKLFDPGIYVVDLKTGQCASSGRSPHGRAARL